MENFILSINIVLPLFLLMATGYLARSIKLVSVQAIQEMNNLVFRVFLPVLLMKNIMDSSLDTIMNPGIFLYILIAMLAMYLSLFFIVPRFEKDRSKCGVMIQAIGRSNYALFGIPLVSSIFPGSDTSLASLLVAMIIPVTNTASVIALETYRGSKADFKTIVRSIIKNPLIISSLLGLVFLLIDLPLPTVLRTAIGDLSKIATPLALFLLGASIDITKVNGNLKQLGIAVLGRLVIIPVIFVGIAILLGFRSVELACVMVTFAAPTAVNSYTMALIMGGDPELAAECVVFTTAGSAITVFLFVYSLMQLGMF